MRTAIRDNALVAGGRRKGFVNMMGVRVGHLVVVAEAFNVNGRPRWLCKCDCGGEYVIEGYQLRAAEKRGSETYSCPACRQSRINEARRARVRR